MATRATKKASPAREELRVRIAALAVASAQVAEAQSAVDEARSKQYQAARRAEELLEEQEAPRDEVVALIAAGDVEALVRPTAEIDAAAQEARAWKRAREVAQEIAESREAALERARASVDEAARAVIDEAVDAEKLIVEAEAARAVVVERQNELANVMTLLPDHSAKRRAINDFLSEAWLLAPLQESQRWAGALQALKADPDASL